MFPSVYRSQPKDLLKPISIQFTGIYDFNGCIREKASYIHRESDYPVYLNYWSELERWQVNFHRLDGNAIYVKI